ncbi:aspartate aminotransferase family protein [Methanomethylovorans sp.]|uniref:aspartate aminotransferase family protein n=1 Tax=Methanomethylovorans sp. TaxID=2758717 RepID=UPI00351C79C4
MSSKDTFEIEDKYFAPFFVKQKISIEKGEGVYVWDEEGRRYLDFTAGWGVTCIGHANPVITDALVDQARKIIQNPNSGLTYSPARARLLSLLAGILPPNLTKVFFTNSGAETNDAAIKLARKVTGRAEVVSTYQSFHGRTISTASATGQAKNRDRYRPLMPNYRFVPYNDLEALERSLDESVAAVIIEPIQGEGGIRIPSDHYLTGVNDLCKKNGSLLIMDEIQTGFFRTGPAFITGACGVEVDFLTMAKGIAGGFPFGAFAMSEAVAEKLEIGDHGGTYCGNPLGCAVSYAVIKYLIDNNISENVEKMGQLALNRMNKWQTEYGDAVADVRGKGLLIMIEFMNEDVATKVKNECNANGLLVTQTQGIGIRIFPALNIRKDELEEGLHIMEDAIGSVVKNSVRS